MNFISPWQSILLREAGFNPAVECSRCILSHVNMRHMILYEIENEIVLVLKLFVQKGVIALPIQGRVPQKSYHTEFGVKMIRDWFERIFFQGTNLQRASCEAWLKYLGARLPLEQWFLSLGLWPCHCHHQNLSASNLSEASIRLKRTWHWRADR